MPRPKAHQRLRSHARALARRRPPAVTALALAAGLVGCSEQTGGDCSPPLVACAGQCVNLASDPSNCGLCGKICPQALCVNGSCAGSGTPAECDPTLPNSCGLMSMYCGPARRCLPCPRGTFSCDGLSTNGCECDNGCIGATCKPATGCSDSQYPGSDGTCQGCPVDSFNCDKATPDCECQGAAGCNGTACKPKPPTCNDLQYLSQDACVDCPTGDYNCDKDIAGCECTDAAGCDGTQCKPKDIPCDDTHYKGTSGACVACPTDTFNCNKQIAGCECNGSGCNEQSCACTESQLWISVSDSCSDCPPGMQNCDGDSDCECDVSAGWNVCHEGACLMTI